MEKCEVKGKVRSSKCEVKAVYSTARFGPWGVLRDGFELTRRLHPRRVVHALNFALRTFRYTFAMFTGIITAQGKVVSLTPNDFGVRLIIDPGKPVAWPAFPSVGDSVAVSGCCLTHAPKPGDQPGHLAFDVIKETLAKTSLGKLTQGSEVNLELSLTPVTAIGGHFVQGHVDGTGVVKHVKSTAEEWVVTVEVPLALVQYLVPKGSIAVDGVSLTLAAIDAAARIFHVALIPTTLALTTLGTAKVGDVVNIECDTITKTVVHILNMQPTKKSAEKVTLETLKTAGFAD